MTETKGFRVADLSQNGPTRFDLRPEAQALTDLAVDLGLLGLRKLSFAGQIEAQGRRDWLLTAKLGATVVQACVVTQDPVTTRIDLPVRRLYLKDMEQPQGDEVEMPEDDEAEPLPGHIDPAAVMHEALALALPLYPRKEDAALDQADFAAPGTRAMTDADTRPFAGLAALREALKPKE